MASITYNVAPYSTRKVMIEFWVFLQGFAAFLGGVEISGNVRLFLKLVT